MSKHADESPKVHDMPRPRAARHVNVRRQRVHPRYEGGS